MKNYIQLITLGVFVFVSCQRGDKVIEKTQNPIENEVKQENDKVQQVVVQKRYPTINIKEHQKITSPWVIEGNSQGVWLASEGEFGTVEVVDEHGQVLNLKNEYGILTAVGEWMTTKPVDFKTIIKFNSKGAKSGKLIFYNNPGEGDGDEAGTSESFEIAVKF